MTKNKKRFRTFSIITISLVILLVSILVIDKNGSIITKAQIMIINKFIKVEYLDEINLLENENCTSNQFRFILKSIDSDEIYNDEVVTYPVIFHIYNQKTLEQFEEIYSIDIPDKYVDYLPDLYITTGSRIEKLLIDEQYIDELTLYKDYKEYTSEIIFENNYDGRKLYIYVIKHIGNIRIAN